MVQTLFVAVLAQIPQFAEQLHDDALGYFPSAHSAGTAVLVVDVLAAVVDDVKVDGAGVLVEVEVIIVVVVLVAAAQVRPIVPVPTATVPTNNEQFW